MNQVLIVGIIVSTGNMFGRLANGVGLPKVTGYILAGILLNPSALGLVPTRFVSDSPCSFPTCPASMPNSLRSFCRLPYF